MPIQLALLGIEVCAEFFNRCLYCMSRVVSLLHQLEVKVVGVLITTFIWICDQDVVEWSEDSKLYLLVAYTVGLGKNRSENMSVRERIMISMQMCYISGIRYRSYVAL